jgi:hypothetical protein
MAQQDKYLRIGFAAFSLLTSFAFVFYAVGIYTSPSATDWLKTFAYVVGGYGLMNVYILSWAWRSKPSWAGTANIVISFCFFGVVLMDLFRDGLQGGQQLLGVLGLACVLAINWFAIKKICA